MNEQEPKTNKLTRNQIAAIGAGSVGAVLVVGGALLAAGAPENTPSHDPNASGDKHVASVDNTTHSQDVLPSETPTVENSPSVSPSAIPNIEPTTVPTQEAQPTVAPTQEAASSASPTPTPEDSGIHETAGEGDSWPAIDESIQKKYYPELDQATIEAAIKQANPDKNPDELYKWGQYDVPGDIDVKVRTIDQVLPAPSPDKPYIYGQAGEGDSWDAMQAEFYPSVDKKVVETAIEKLNPDKDPADLYEWGKFEVPKDIDIKAETPDTK